MAGRCEVKVTDCINFQDYYCLPSLIFALLREWGKERAKLYVGELCTFNHIFVEVMKQQTAHRADVTVLRCQNIIPFLVSISRLHQYRSGNLSPAVTPRTLAALHQSRPSVRPPDLASTNQRPAARPRVHDAMDCIFQWPLLRQWQWSVGRIED